MQKFALKNLNKLKINYTNALHEIRSSFFQRKKRGKLSCLKKSYQWFVLYKVTTLLSFVAQTN